jgi:hypothetical protein
MSSITLIRGGAIDWRGRLQIQRDRIRTGEYRIFGRLAALYFEVCRDSNPKMLELGRQVTADGRAAWPGKNLDWFETGPALAFSADGQELLFCSPEFPLPPEAPDPAFIWRKVGDMPRRVPQLIEDRGVRIAGSDLLCIQPVSAIQWVLTVGAKGVRQIHGVVPDASGASMAFLYDTGIRQGYLVGGKVL